MSKIPDKQLHNLIKNMDYILRSNRAKFVLVASDFQKEGKSTFLTATLPGLAELYERRILVYDCQKERNDLLEKRMAPGGSEHQFIRKTGVPGLDYLHADDLTFLKAQHESNRLSSQMAYFNEVAKEYDSVFINIKTSKKADESLIPVLPLDGAIIVRSSKSVKKEKKALTTLLEQREIPILGLVMNEGLA